MAHDVVKLIAAYESAVVTVFDTSGLPASFRCRPAASNGGLLVSIPPWVEPVEGRAGVMCHVHDDGLWHQRSLTVRGRLEPASGGWVFHPERTILGMGYGRFPLLKMMLRGRRRAARYLAARGLPRPEIPWAEMAAIKREAFRSKG